MSDPKPSPATEETSARDASAAGSASVPAPAPAHASADVAAAASATWRAIDAALRPILGARGVEALYWRSLHLAAATQPWLLEAVDPTEAAIDLEALAAALAARPADSAEAGSRMLLDQFEQLLVSLVGASLTARLLATVPAMCADTPTPQDAPP